MWSRFLHSTVVNSIENRLDLVFSFQPIFYSLVVFGNDFDVSVPRSPCRRHSLIVVKIVIFVLMQISNIVANFGESSDPEFDLKSTTVWLHGIEKYVSAFWNFLFPLVMFHATTFKFLKLWKKAEKMKKIMDYRTSFLRELRKVSTGLTIFAVVVVNFFFFFVLFFSTIDQMHLILKIKLDQPKFFHRNV